MDNDDFISSPLNVPHKIECKAWDNILPPFPLTEGTTTVCSVAVYNTVVAAHLCWSGDTSSVLVTPPPRHQQQQHGLINM